MKILQLCKKFPFPLKDGESIAVTYLSQALESAGCEVSLLAMNTSKHYFDIAQLPASFNQYKNIWTVDVDNRLKMSDAFLNLFSSKSYHIERFVSAAFEQKLIQVLENQQFDLIQLETLYLTPYIDTIRKYSNAKIVMRSHNVEFEIWERLSKNEKNPVKKLYLQYLTKKLKRFELAQLSKLDAILAITARDLERYQCHGFQQEAAVLPIGLDLEDYQLATQSFKKPMALSFIGSLDWQPNIEGLHWFLDHAWQDIHKSFPNLEFHIAGRNMPEDIKNLSVAGVKIHGEVADAQRFIADYSLMLVPLLSGGGMRAKILEGMALGKVIVSTSVGIEGIPVTNGEEAFVANSPEDFRAAIQYCASLNGELKQMGQQARNFVQQHYDNKFIAQQAVQFYADLCQVEIPKSKKMLVA
jgi:polysaccharide biosynthesis protein PslH